MNPRARNLTQKTVALLKRQGVARPRDLQKQGISREMLGHLVRKGVVERIGRGLYKLPGLMQEHSSLVQASRVVPKGVVCLLSALRFHELGTQEPFEVWIALPSKAWHPRVTSPQLRVVRFSGQALSEGIVERRIAGGTIRVYNPAKTVADTFKYRNKVGIDVAVEALRDCLRTRKASVNELWKYARICRVQRIMRPYLEALT
jgi:predicted transcriptional regulator of viral defense system